MAFQYDRPPKGETQFDWKNQIYRRGYWRCRNCGHWAADIQMNLTDFYQGEYVNGTYGSRMEEAFQKILGLPDEKSDNHARVQRVLHFAKQRLGDNKTPSLLDVGSGLAVFPYRMREAGWRVTALDPDPRAAAHAREQAGVQAIHADLFEWEPEVGLRFDVISLNKVLEHVEQPVGMLARTARWIRPGGFVYVEVPDVSAAASGPGREEFFIEHLHIFSVESLKKTFEKASFPSPYLKAVQERSGKFTIVGICEK